MVDYIQMMGPRLATINILQQCQDTLERPRSPEVIVRVRRIIIIMGRAGSQVMMVVHLDTITAN